MVACSFGAMSEIVRIDADTVTTDQPRREPQEIPFGSGSVDHVHLIDAQLLANRRELVHQRNVEVALGILEHFSGLRRPDVRSPMNTSRYDRAIQLGNGFQRRAFA